MIKLPLLLLVIGFVTRTHGADQIPEKIDYKCDDFGNITILTSKSGLKSYLTYGDHCDNGKGGDGKNIIIKGCKIGTPVKIILVQVEEHGIVKKEDFKEFSMECDQKILPYNLTLTAMSGVTVPSAYPVNTLLHQINTVTAKPLEKLIPVMEISRPGGVSSITIGDALTLRMSKHKGMTDDTELMALECVARPVPAKESSVYTLWSATSCQANDLFKGAWVISNTSISHEVIAFRFESSDTVLVTCNVRICPDGDPKNLCTLEEACDVNNKGNSRKRRRTVDQSSYSLSATFTAHDEYQKSTSGTTRQYSGFTTLIIVTALDYWFNVFM